MTRVKDRYWFRMCLLVFVAVVLAMCVLFTAAVMAGSAVGS